MRGGSNLRCPLEVRGKHEALGQQLQVVAVGKVLQRHVKVSVVLPLVVEDQVEQRDFAIDPLRRGGTILPILAGRDGQAETVGHAPADGQCFVK